MKDLKKEIEIIAAFFSDIWKKDIKFYLFFFKLILGKVRVDEFTRPRQKIDVRYEFGFKVILNSLLYK